MIRRCGLTFALTAVVSGPLVAGCHPAALGRLSPRPVSYCGQDLTEPSVTTQGFQTLDTAGLPPVDAPATSVLPPPIASDSPLIDGWSNLLILSRDCASVRTVDVAPAPFLRTVGVAYDNDRTGITALLLARLKTAPVTSGSVRVLAFQGQPLVGEAQLVV